MVTRGFGEHVFELITTYTGLLVRWVALGCTVVVRLETDSPKVFDVGPSRATARPLDTDATKVFDRSPNSSAALDIVFDAP